MENRLSNKNTIDDAALEQVIIGGDLSKLSPSQRVQYYRIVCESLGLNPLTKPFDYIVLNGKLTLYAKKDATDQLRAIKGVSIDDVDLKEVGDNFIVKVKGHDSSGRSDVEIGVVRKSDMQGNTANAQMKAVTKAKRRLTLSLCGLGWLDETEVETIPDAKPVVVSETGEIIESPAGIPEIPEPKPAKTAFNEEKFLKNFNPPKDFQPMPLDEAKKIESEKDGSYATMTTEKLFYRMNSLIKQLKNHDISGEEADLVSLNLNAILTILLDRKMSIESAV
jgi:hypothetical protein